MKVSLIDSHYLNDDSIYPSGGSDYSAVNVVSINSFVLI